MTIHDALSKMESVGVKWNRVNRIQNDLYTAGVAFFSRGKRVAFYNEALDELEMES